MKQFLENLYKALFKVDLIQTVEMPCPQPVIPERTNNDKLLELALKYYNTDPTPRDEQPDEVACVHSLTTILKKFYPDMAIMTYTPYFLDALLKDKRFKVSTEFKPGSIIISPTGSGNGRKIGHTGIIARDGKILSNASSNGLWFDKFDQVSWVDYYSRQGGLSLYIFELV